MTPEELRGLTRGAVLLLLAGIVRLFPTGGDAQPGPEVAASVDSLLTASRSRAAEADLRRRPLEKGERIDPNRATAVELDRLPGVGPGVANAIVQDRAENGPFSSAEGLLRVRGVGATTLERIRPHLDLAAGAPARSGGRSRAVAGVTARIGLNTATADELERLPGIGPALAKAIVELRTERGRFSTLEDLLAVSGIGPRTLDRIKPHAQID